MCCSAKFTLWMANWQKSIQSIFWASGIFRINYWLFIPRHHVSTPHVDMVLLVCSTYRILCFTSNFYAHLYNLWPLYYKHLYNPMHLNTAALPYAQNSQFGSLGFVFFWVYQFHVLVHTACHRMEKINTEVSNNRGGENLEIRKFLKRSFCSAQL